MGPEKNWLRFWDILGGQVQNDLKWLGNRFWGRELNFLKNVKPGKPGNRANRAKREPGNRATGRQVHYPPASSALQRKIGPKNACAIAY